MPSSDEMSELERICEMPTLQLLKRNKDYGRTDLVEILKSNARNRYSHTDIVQAADLIE